MRWTRDASRVNRIVRECTAGFGSPLAVGRVGGSCQPDWLWDRGCFPGPTTSFEGLCRIWETDHQRRSVGSCQPESLVSCFKVCTPAIEKELRGERERPDRSLRLPARIRESCRHPLEDKGVQNGQLGLTDVRNSNRWHQADGCTSRTACGAVCDPRSRRQLPSRLPARAALTLAAHLRSPTPPRRRTRRRAPCHADRAS